MAIDDLGKLKSDIGFLSSASPQQMGTVSRLLQQGQQSDPYESLAFLIANNMQRDMRQPNPQAPQQTILQKRLAELQTQPNPMMGGMPNVGPNQMALQQSAMQNPNTAGIAAAPENIPGAATGGLVAFAEGGEVRRFNGQYNDGSGYLGDMVMGEAPSSLGEMYNTVADILTPKPRTGFSHGQYQTLEEKGAFGPPRPADRPYGLGFLKDASDWYAKTMHEGVFGDDGKEEPTPKHEEVKPGADKTPTTQKITEQKPTPLATQKVSSAPTDKISGTGTTDFRRAFGLDDVAAPPATPPTSSTDSNEKQIQAIQDALGTPYSMSAELKSQLEKHKADAQKSSFLKAGLSGLGAMMAAPTEHWKKALGMGLISAVNQYDQDKDAGRYEDALLAQQMAEEKAPTEARQQAGLEFLKQRAAMQTAGAKSQGDLVKQALANQAKIQAAQIAAAARSQGDTPDKVEQKLLVNLGATLGPAGMSAEEIRQMAKSIAYGGAASPGAGGAPLSVLGRISGDQYQPHS